METLMSNQTAQAKPEVKLPKAVMVQLDKANELIKAEMDKKLKETPQSNVTEPVVQPEQEATPIETEPVAPVAPTVDKENTVDYWKHRFLTSQGMFDAEKTRLRTENSVLKERLTGLEAKLSEFEDKLRAAERQTPKTVDLKKYLPDLTDEQVDTYGPEVLQSIVRAATLAAEEASERRLKEELDRRITPVKKELEENRQSVQSAKEDLFWDALEKRLPNWAVINDNPAFRNWLAEVDTFSGVPRQALLTQAQKALDSERVIAMFETFIKSSSAPNTTTVAEIQRRVVPDPVGQTATLPVVTDTGDFITKKQIQEHYKKAALGGYKYRPQDYQAMEKKIQAARLANRVR